MARYLKFDIIKQIVWLSDTRKRLKGLPIEARKQAGEQLWRVQQGAKPADWKPMPSIGPGTVEIRIHRPYEFRVVYVAIHPEGIYVLDVFEKRTQQTSRKDLSRARAKYAEMERQRQKTRQ